MNRVEQHFRKNICDDCTFTIKQHTRETAVVCVYGNKHEFCALISYKNIFSEACNTNVLVLEYNRYEIQFSYKYKCCTFKVKNIHPKKPETISSAKEKPIKCRENLVVHLF